MWSARKCKPPHFCIKTSLSTISVCTEGRPLYGECGVVCVCLGVNVSRGASDAIVLELDTMASGTEVTEMNPHNQKLPAWEHKENQHRFRFSGLAAVDSPGLTSLLHPGTPGLHLHQGSHIFYLLHKHFFCIFPKIPHILISNFFRLSLLADRLWPV